MSEAPLQRLSCFREKVSFWLDQIAKKMQMGGKKHGDLRVVRRSFDVKVFKSQSVVCVLFAWFGQKNYGRLLGQIKTHPSVCQSVFQDPKQQKLLLRVDGQHTTYTSTTQTPISLTICWVIYLQPVVDVNQCSSHHKQVGTTKKWVSCLVGSDLRVNLVA